ncbi:MAG: zinc ABC transporter substrate-binding protein [Oscillospiraceae bacterium]|nr:zinc ABC transporter substrate-binding protein [Oscillospiraceae bacterium]
MRSLKSITTLFLLLTLLLSGCTTGGSANSSSGTATRPDVESKPISVVATIFPAYDWARQIIGTNDDSVALTLLLDKGADLHSYQPTVEDIYKISNCDLFIYVGGESDRWVPDALKQASNPNMKVICLMDTLGSAVKEEEALEGMEAEEEEEGEDEAEGPEYDEHIWLSLRYAQTLCDAIRDKLIACDPAGKDAYTANCAAYTEKLHALDSAYMDAVSNAERDTLLFADRFPFRYFADDYGLKCYAAFQGCSAETEASFETVSFLVSKLDELALPYVMKLEQSDGRLADTIIENSAAHDAQILELNSLQSVTAEGVKEGVSYLGVMEQNLETLKTALGAKLP